MVPNGKNCVLCSKCNRVYQLPGRGAVTDLPKNNFALCILQLLKDRRSWWFIHSNHFILASTVFNNPILISIFSFWCLTCEAVPDMIPITLSWIGARTWMNCALCFRFVPHIRVILWPCGSDSNGTFNWWNLKVCRGRKRRRQSSCWWQRTAAARRKDDWRRRIGLQLRASPYQWSTASFRSRRASKRSSKIWKKSWFEFVGCCWCPKWWYNSSIF